MKTKKPELDVDFIGIQGSSLTKDEEKKILNEFVVCEIVFGQILDEIILMKNYSVSDFQGKSVGTAYITTIKE